MPKADCGEIRPEIGHWRSTMPSRLLRNFSGGCVYEYANCEPMKVTFPAAPDTTAKLIPVVSLVRPQESSRSSHLTPLANTYQEHGTMCDDVKRSLYRTYFFDLL